MSKLRRLTALNYLNEFNDRSLWMVEQAELSGWSVWTIELAEIDD